MMQPETLFAQAKRALNLPVTTPLQSAYQFGADADELAQLVVIGQKTATTSAYDLYEPEEPLPQVGAYDVILDANNVPVCVTKNDTVTIKSYLDIDATHAFHEGEGDRSYAYWRQAHDTFFTTEYAATGRTFHPATAKMVLETFHVIYVPESH